MINNKSLKTGISILLLLLFCFLAVYLHMCLGLALFYDTSAWDYSLLGYKARSGLSYAHLVYSILMIICMGMMILGNNRKCLLSSYFLTVIISLLFVCTSWFVVERIVIGGLPDVEVDDAASNIRAFITGEIHVLCLLSIICSSLILMFNHSKRKISQ